MAVYQVQEKHLILFLKWISAAFPIEFCIIEYWGRKS